MPNFNAEDIDTKSRSQDSDFDEWLEKNLDIIKALLMHGRDFYFDIVAGKVSGHTPRNVVAHDATIGNTMSTVGPGTGLLATYSTSNAIDSISSDDVADTHAITIMGLDSDYEPMEPQTITLNGQTRVAIPNPLFRIDEIVNLTNTRTLGHIWVYEDTPLASGKPVDLTKIRGSIHKSTPSSGMPISFEHHTPSMITIPAGKECFVVFGKTSVSDAKALGLSFWARPAGQVWKLVHPIEIKDNTYDYFFKLPGWIDEKTDLEVRAYVDSGSAVVTAAYDIVLRDKII